MSISSGFRQAFCEFFGVQLKEPQQWSVEREYPLGGNLRVDLALINSDGETYLIENKINDRNYHFKEYEASPVGKQSKGLWLIAGHTVTELAPSKKWTVRTWTELVQHLEQRNWPEDEDLIRSFKAYVKGACQMAPIKEIRLNDEALVSLFYLNNLFDKVISSFQSLDVKCRLYRTSYNFDNGNMGKYFSISITGSKNLVFPWLGLTYEDEPCIGIWFDKDTGWGRPVHSHPGLRSGDKEYYKIYWEPSGTWFELKDSFYGTFMSSDHEQQAQILCSFFSEVIRNVVSAIKQKVCD